jgi:hypothetical protein
MNLNELAKDITLKEGLKKSTNIAQVKEIIKLILYRLSRTDQTDLLNTLARYKRIRK